MKLIIALASAALASQAAQGQPVQHSPGHSMASANPALISADEAAVKTVLRRYKSAIETLDATGTEALFTADSSIFETGGAEGNYANYLAHHLGPELKAFKAFGFSDYKIDVRFEGAIALATETYKYRIETRTGEIAERQGVATSALKKVGGQWKILSMHNSARKPKGS